MNKKLVSVFLLTMFLLSITGSAFAWSGKADADGKPVQFNISGPKGYYIWQDEQGFHVWTTTRGERHTFSGVVRTDGRFEHVRGYRLEEGDTFNVNADRQERSWFKSSEGDRNGRFKFEGREVNLGQDKIHFQFENAGGSDGINFRVENARYVDFELFIDGRPIPRREIHISDNGWHPESNHFRLYRD